MAANTANDAAAKAATLACATVPVDIVKNIQAILREEYPQVVIVLRLAEMYEARFGKQLRPDTYGYKSLLEMMKSIKENTEVFYHQLLHLWVAKYKECVEPAKVVNVHEVEDENNMAINEIRHKETSQMDVDSDADITIQSFGGIKLPAPTLSVRSYASSSASASSMRRSRLPPPPPSVDWASGSKTVLGKRQGSQIGRDGKKMEMDQTASVCSVDESIPAQENRLLDIERRNVKYISFDRELEPLTYDSLVLGRTIGVEVPAAYVDTTFCSRNTLERLMKIKYEIQNVSADKYKLVQDRMIEFGNGPIFHHSEAYLLANIDALTSWCITRPTNRHGELLTSAHEVLVVVDIHGGPGGFAEYILTKRQWEAKVFGFTFKDEAYEYQLQESGHYPKESFESWAGWDGNRGDGSIYRPEFVEKFVMHVLRITGWQGVHVCIGGGKELTPCLDEDRKELQTKALLLAECTIALRCLREGGTFLLRLYDVFTPFTVGLVYLMYRAFEQGFKPCQEIANYLSHCHSSDYSCHVNQKYPEDKRADIVELVPTELIQECHRFYDYIYDSNAGIGEKQLEETSQICNSIKYRNENRMASERVAAVRRKCCREWNCPGTLRQEPKYKGLSVELFAGKIMRPYPENILRKVERDGEVLLTYPVMDRDLVNPKQWSFVCVGRDRGFYLSLGGDRVYRFSAGIWKMITVDRIELADSTLVYGDIVDEITQLDGKQIIVTAFHIIDGMVLGRKNIRDLPYNERMDMCSKFAKSMNKSSREDYIHVRAKKTMEATRLEAALSAVHKEQMKGRVDNKKRPLAPVDTSDPKTAVFAHTGYLFLQTLKEGGSSSDFLVTMQNRLYWRLDDNNDRNPQGPLLPRPKDQKLLQETAVCSPALVHYINSF